jgi:hypothetical protein
MRENKGAVLTISEAWNINYLLLSYFLPYLPIFQSKGVFSHTHFEDAPLII